MVALPNGVFDAQSVLDAPDVPDNVPAGIYQIKVLESDAKETNGKTGMRLNLKVEIVSGEYAGFTFYTGINYINNNPKTQAAGQKQVAQLAMACGFPHSRQTEQFHNIPVWAELTVQPASVDKHTGREYPPRNEVKEFFFGARAQAVAANALGLQQQPAQAQQQNFQGQQPAQAQQQNFQQQNFQGQQQNFQQPAQGQQQNFQQPAQGSGQNYGQFQNVGQNYQDGQQQNFQQPAQGQQQNFQQSAQGQYQGQQQNFQQPAHPQQQPAQAQQQPAMNADGTMPWRV